MNTILLLILLSMMLSSTNPVFANQPPKTSDQNVLNYKQFLQATPKSVVRIHGPLNFSSQPKLSLLPGDPCFLMPIKTLSGNEIVEEYVSVMDRVVPFSGFQIYKFESPITKELLEFCRNNATERTILSGKEIFAFDEKNLEYWDYTKMTKSTKLFYSFLNSDTIFATTSLGYFNPHSKFSKLVPVKVGPRRRFSLFKTGWSPNPKSICVERIFDVKDFFFRKEVPERIEAIQFDRTGNLLKGPFKIIVYTRRDRLQDAQLLFRQFTDLKDEKKSIKRLEACKYELALETDSEFFYFCLLCLLSCGNPDSAEKEWEH